MRSFLITTLRTLIRFLRSWMRWKEDGPLFSMHPRTLTTEQYSQSCDEKPQHTGSTIMKSGDKANYGIEINGLAKHAFLRHKS